MKTGCLTIGFDFSNGEDAAVLAVGRVNEDQIKIVNMFVGEEALKMYDRLVIVGRYRADEKQ